MVVVLATAITASVAVASASAAQFRGESYPVGFDGSITTTLEISANTGKVKCTGGSLTGSEISASSQASLAPSLKCKVYGIEFGGKLEAENCQFVFNSSEGESLAGSLGVSCAGGSTGMKTSVIGSNCVISIPAQAALSGMTYSNSGAGASRSISATANVSGVTYKETGTNCVKNGVTSTNGTITGTVAIHGRSVPSVYDVGVYLASAQIEEPAAEGPKFRQAAYPAEVTSQLEGEVSFGTQSGTKKCSGLSLSGSQLSSSAGLTLHPTFSGCKAFNLTEPVDTTGCNLVINIPDKVSTEGKLSIVCEAGHEIIKGPFTGSNCVTTYPTQLGLGSVTLANQGTGISRTVKATINLSGMSYTETGSFCAAPGAHSNGTMSATVTLKGAQSTKQQGLYIQ
ncbi:MAG: hypothetical protein ACJ75T_01875 [Solirubrobacterales bacterium]